MATKIRTEEDYQKLLAKLSGLEEPELAQTKDASDTQKTTNRQKEKRQGVKELPIIDSLKKAQITVEASTKHITIQFDGARLFTLNELFALLQYRSYVVFGYKKQWQSLVKNALRIAGKNKPRFEGKCKLTVFRQAKKKVDRDSLMVMFKFIIDALKDDGAKHIGVFPDDNPDIIYEDEKIQTIGSPIVAIRVDLIPEKKLVKEKTLDDLFSKRKTRKDISKNEIDNQKIPQGIKKAPPSPTE